MAWARRGAAARGDRRRWCADAALAAAGGEPAQLASLTVYIVDVPDYRAHVREIGAVWRRLVGTDYPAMAGIGINRLWDDDAVVEIQGFAVV